jgi:pimeloyl-ACP methyl ester carboxylesterase
MDRLSNGRVFFLRNSSVERSPRLSLAERLASTNLILAPGRAVRYVPAMAARAFLILLLPMLAGCLYSTPVNPSFPISADQAGKVLEAASNHPRPLKRPLVIVSGFMDPGIAAWSLSSAFRSYTHDDRIIGVSLDFGMDEEEFRWKIVDSVDRAFPSKDPHLTTEVDVIGYSMGGIAARYAALMPAPRRRLQIHRLFTISSPHIGAVAAEGIPLDLVTLQEQMTPGSDFLHSINYTDDPNSLYPIYAYVCLGDKEVGEQYAAPPAQRAWWLSRPAMFSAHIWAYQDPRIRADILRRLLDETPLTTEPPAPLPPAETRRANEE